MRDSPRSPMAKTNGSSREGNRIINPHSRIPKSTNKQTNKEHFKPVFGSGTSDLAKTRPLKNRDPRHDLEVIALWELPS